MNYSIAIDTNIFIYYFQQNPQFGEQAKKFFASISPQTKVVTSIVTLTELLSFNQKEEYLSYLEGLLVGIPNIILRDVIYEIGITAAKIRRKYTYRLADAIQIATALYEKADIFVTNDERLKNCKEIKVTLLSEM